MSGPIRPRAGRTSASTAFLVYILGFALCFSTAVLASPTMPSLDARSQLPFSSEEISATSFDVLGVQRVNVTLAVMSRCPDALACEAAFDKVLDRVNAKTHLTMTYIGTIDNDSKHNKYGADCMHGEQECAGNVQQLCVQDALNPVRAGEDYDLSPSAAQKKWWNFLQCQNYAGTSKIGNEDLAQRCLRLVDGPSWDKDGIAKCVHGKRGRKLLQHSIKASKAANLGTSCTIVFENGKRCTRDGGAWKNCDLGHQPSDFVNEIERIWSDKNGGSKHVSSTSPSKVASGSPSRIVKRQSSASPTDNTGFNNPFAGNSTPPSVFSANVYQFSGPNLPTPFLAFAGTAIALFVIVVCFVLLRIILRNRRLRRLGLLPDGPFDRLLGPTREIEDTLTPPKLLEARIAHDARPTAYDAEVKAKGWDAVMPISAAVPPVLYSDLFPRSKGQDGGSSNGAGDGNDASVGGQTDFSYPPTSSQSGGLTRRLHVPGFLRRNGDGSSHDDAAGPGAAGSAGDAGANGSAGEAGLNSDSSTPASVNVTVLIAMPSQRTVFPSTSTLKSQRSLNMNAIDTSKIDEVEESADSQHGGLRRTASMKSFRTAASVKSIGDARREAFFNKMNEGEANVVDVPATNLDDEDEEELPELVFGTASVPIFTRIAGAGPVGREPFAGTMEAYQPLRSELVRLVTSAHQARERKVAMDAAAQQAEKDAANADDGQTTLDERSTNQGQATVNTNNGVVPATDRRVSASETIDSETAAIIGAPGLATVPTAHQDGLGDVVGRMMATDAPSSAMPAPAIGNRVSSSTADAAPYNVDPLLGDNAPSHDASNQRNASVPERAV
uniref:Uncharacterized protein n=1 Tax=Kalmanozyma brasiliensis (strain GHG001) TaxID=1365824 RepID=V5EX73_KALBG